MLMNSRYLNFFLVFLVLKAVVLGVLICCGAIHLAPDEAQYWTWSQALDWGYYSKPPAIAWQIRLTTAIFGNTEFGVRFGALLIGFLLPCVVYFSARAMTLSLRIAFWAGMLTAFSPLGIFLSFAATTDGGSILFFTLAMATLAIGIQRPQGPSYLLIGLWIFCGALFKWVAFVAWPLIFVFLFFYPNLRKKSLIWGLLISCLALFPSLYWNVSHDFATFKHVGGNIVQGSEKKSGNVFDFTLAQIGLLSPVYAIFLIAGLFAIFRKEHRSFRPLVICAGVTSAVLIYIVFSFFQKMQPNWALYLYPIGFVVAAWWACGKQTASKWLPIGTCLSVLFVAVALAIPWMQSKGYFQIPYKANPFRQNLGWDRIATILFQAGYHPDEHFLFADKYQTTSLLSFYGPAQQRAYFFNLGQQRKNQFLYWPGMQEYEVGQTGIFVVFENVNEQDLPWFETHYTERLSPYFSHVEYLGSYPLFTANGKSVKFALLFRVENYNGRIPKTLEKY